MEILMTCAGLAQPSPRLVCMWRSARLYGVGVVKGAMLLDTSGRISIFFVLSYVCDYGFALPLYHTHDQARRTFFSIVTITGYAPTPCFCCKDCVRFERRPTILMGA